MHISWIHRIHMIAQRLPVRSLDQRNYSPRSKDTMVNIQKRRRRESRFTGLHNNGCYRICTYASGVPRWSSLGSSGQLSPFSSRSRTSLGSRRPTSSKRPRNTKICHFPSCHGIHKGRICSLPGLPKPSHKSCHGKKQELKKVSSLTISIKQVSN